ncbi:hypothetical protein [Pseudoalteromonas aurantia]|uniref:ATPase AAA-type core domain-containing protein n=1 Tax=Pseudoalteromonas aurantia TaxID=43654 RepID=A0ABY2W000_9GAMM|nr:hypothetical protein [Pseudoalteromonas aurantia]TMO76397.1 hypothetical protein CWC20_05740 [Pseudoalteromonas aurantia]
MIKQPELPLKEATTDIIVERLILDMLQKFHTRGAIKDLDERIENAWLDFRGTTFLARSVTPTYLRGFPGQGKTTSYRVAAMRVADMLNMPFVMNPDEQFTPTGKELLFVVQELSGQVSAVDFGGIPNVQKFVAPNGESQEFMTKIPNKRLAALKYAGASVLLLDDFSNASPNIQNVALSILTENRFQGLDLGNTLVGATGNLGASDGTHVSSTSNAIVTRVANFIVVDTIDHWIERTQLEFADDVGDGGISSFLRRYPDLFHAPKASRDGVPYPCPRSWSLFVPKLREILFYFKQKKKKEPDFCFPFDELESEASGFLGLEVSNRLAIYFLSFMQTSDPLAKRLVDSGKWSDKDRALFKQEYANGYAASSQQFAYQFMTALADYAAKAFIEDLPDKNNWLKIAQALANGLYGERIDHALICYGAHYFAIRIILLAESSNIDTNEIGILDEKGRPDLNESFLIFIAQQIARLPIALEQTSKDDDGRIMRLMDETFCEIVSHFRGYQSQKYR